MKVYMVNVLSSRGSTGRICTDLADLLSRSGGSARIAYGRGDAAAPYDKISYKISDRLAVYANTLRARLLDDVGFSGKAAAQRLIKDIGTFAPDVIHLHNLHGYYLDCETLFGFLKSYGKPVVWTFHDCWPFTGHCAYFTYADCMQWQTACRDCPELKAYPACYTGGNVRANYQRKKALFASLDKLTVVTPSRWLADLTQQSFFADRPAVVIPNGIDTEIFHPMENAYRDERISPNRKTVLAVANVWTGRKGFDDCIALAKALGADYQLVMVGLNQKQLRQLPSYVVGIAHTQDVFELAALYTAADVFVNLTYEDNFPTVNLEAQACGTPVVAYHVGGNPENILTLEAKTQLVPTGDVTRAAAAVRSLEKNQQTITACRAFALQYDKTKQLSGYLDLYRKLVSNEDIR